jgi:hypothetical protein
MSLLQAFGQQAGLIASQLAACAALAPRDVWTAQDL